jgi:7-cyano-7-deazaguanine synthase
MKQVVLSLSGGMDSSSLLLHLLALRIKVTAISIDYGQKHKIELQRAMELVEYLKANNINLNYKQIDLSDLSTLLNSALIEGGDEVPEGHYEQENMKETVVPNRNKIFSSIMQAIALSLANKTNEECGIALGIHAGDHAIYPDCRQSFRDADFSAFQQGNWNADKVKTYTPYLHCDKADILMDALDSCDSLAIHFDEVFKRTNTSYKPTKEGLSDYKSASSVERIEAFLKIGRVDPVQYVDGWECASAHVKKVLSNAKD